MRAVETTPAASLNVGEEVTLVGRTQSKINQPPSLEKNERAWKDHFHQPARLAWLREPLRSFCFYFFSSARLEGMWSEVFAMASSSKGSSLYTSHLTQDRCAILSTIAAIRGPFNRTAAARRRRSGIDVRRSVHALHGTERVSMPSSGEIRTVELTRGRETGAAILPYAPWHFLYFFPLPQGQGSLRPTLLSLR